MDNTKKITCPQHGHDDHQATLYTWGHRYAGVWECDAEGISDSCEHNDTRHEEVELNTTTNGEHDTYKSTLEICNECEVSLDG